MHGVNNAGQQAALIIRWFDEGDVTNEEELIQAILPLWLPLFIPQHVSVVPFSFSHLDVDLGAMRCVRS